jgi:hypothetical protein
MKEILEALIAGLCWGIGVGVGIFTGMRFGVKFMRENVTLHQKQTINLFDKRNRDKDEESHDQKTD